MTITLNFWNLINLFFVTYLNILLLFIFIWQKILSWYLCFFNISMPWLLFGFSLQSVPPLIFGLLEKWKDELKQNLQDWVMAYILLYLSLANGKIWMSTGNDFQRRIISLSIHITVNCCCCDRFNVPITGKLKMMTPSWQENCWGKKQ